MLSDRDSSASMAASPRNLLGPLQGPLLRMANLCFDTTPDDDFGIALSIYQVRTPGGRHGVARRTPSFACI